MTNNEARRNDKFVSAGRGNQHARRARYPDVVAALVAKLKQITNISGDRISTCDVSPRRPPYPNALN